MTRDEAYQTLTSLIKNPNLIKHHLACEAVMRGLYRYLISRYPNEPSLVNAAEEKWGIVGLLHDADYELTKGNPEKHTIVLEEKIGAKLEPDVMFAIKSHNWKFLNIQPKTLMDWSIYACDELTGLIVAATLVYPDKKLTSVTVNFIMNRFNEKSFAKGADRESIMVCEEKLGIPILEFIIITLIAMQSINAELGL